MLFLSVILPVWEGKSLSGTIPRISYKDPQVRLLACFHNNKTAKEINNDMGNAIMLLCCVMNLWFICFFFTQQCQHIHYFNIQTAHISLCISLLLLGKLLQETCVQYIFRFQSLNISCILNKQICIFLGTSSCTLSELVLDSLIIKLQLVSINILYCLSLQLSQTYDSGTMHYYNAKVLHEKV